MELLPLLHEFGSLSLQSIWLPVALWTALTLLVLGAMRYLPNVHSLYQYHGRIALMIALPAGVFFTRANQWVGSFLETYSEAGTKFIVIQSPISVTAAADSVTAPALFDPATVAGILTLLIAAAAVVRLSGVVADMLALRSFSKRLNKRRVDTVRYLSPANLELAGSIGADILLSYSPDADVPFTYGWRRPVIVLPDKLKAADTQMVNMAVRHELMHIRHRDYLFNNLMVAIKALFWFHPLVHRLYRDVKKYRELSCDSEVLSDRSISRKMYARLLLELAPKNTFKNTQAVSMSVDPSTLKKRILSMTSQAHNPRLFKTSLYAMFLSAILMTGFIACSDIQDSGITNREVEHAQAEMLKSGDAGSPLYVLNGEVIERIDPPDALSRIKTKYIEHIEVIKGRKAIEEYGEKGKNGVIKLTLIDKEKALNDLKDAPAGNAASRAEKGEDFFVVVEKMPKLKGGMVQLQNCVEYPREAKEAGIEGRVIVQFIVNENGQVENPNIIRGIGGGADEEALRCVEQAEFEPGKQRGQPVRVQFSMPIIFKLTDSQSIEKEESSAYFESYKVEGKIMELRDLTLSEDGILRGTVYDRSKEVPLAGANVVLQSLQRGAATGPDGQFTLRGIDSKNGIPKIRISYTGYRSITAEIQ